MQRRLQAALLAIALSAASAAAFAQDNALTVRVKADASPATVQQQLTAAADTWCRAHPVNHTVSACRRDLTAALSHDFDTQTHLASAKGPTLLAGR